ncbi:hypothetical protein [Neobacillus mesonae]|uniref:hypothetical protein n=1 Tax=Neobacillus mesonae TaxID=1193713 RepID=UPI00203F3EBF|nr:hypothetical protein [Neobacillus mesonae]MCM3569352.1 hypothetical protein [Neobacillus mesonae]
MVRQSDYLGKSYQDIDPEEVKQKINREPISTEEIAIYLEHYGTYHTRPKKKSITKRTIENHIAKIVEDSNGLLTKEDFQWNGVYKIDPRFHGLLLTLLDSNYFDGRKNKRRLSTRGELYSSLVDNVKVYLNDEDKREIMDHPSYTNAELEGKLTERLSSELALLFRELYHADSTVRYRMMKYVIENISETRKWITETDTRIFTGKLMFGAKIAADEHDENAKLLKEKIQSDSLEDYIMMCLADKVHGKESVEEADEESIIGYPAIYLTDLLYDLTNKDVIESELKDIDENITSSERFKLIEEKAKQILNMEDPFEGLIYNSLIHLLKIYLVTPYVSMKESREIMDFIEKAMEKDKWDILREFNQ